MVSFVGDWKDELQQTIDNSKEITWRTRNPIDGTSKDIDAEEDDLERSGANAIQFTLTNLEYQIEQFLKNDRCIALQEMKDKACSL